MFNRSGTVYPCCSNKRVQFEILCHFQIQHETPEKGRRTYRPKHYDYNNKNEVNSPNVLSNDNFLLLIFDIITLEFLLIFITTLREATWVRMKEMHSNEIGTLNLFLENRQDYALLIFTRKNKYTVWRNLGKQRIY